MITTIKDREGLEGMTRPLYLSTYHTGEKSVIVLPIQLFIFEKKINPQNKKIEYKNKTAETEIYTVSANNKCL